MKTKYVLFNLFLLIFFVSNTTAQSKQQKVEDLTVLSKGDIAFTIFQTDSDEFAFILLKEIDVNTTIYFTSNGWDNDADDSGTNQTWGNTDEGTIEWTSTRAMNAGDQVYIMGDLSSGLYALGGKITVHGTWSLSDTSDAIIAYQGSGVPNDGSEVDNFIFAFNTGTNDWTDNASSSTTTGIPDGLTDGTDAISFSSITTNDNYRYDCSVTTTSSISTLKTSLLDTSNYDSSNKKYDYNDWITCFHTVWTGATDSNWYDATNWDNGVPAYGYSANIPNALTNYPEINETTAVYVTFLEIESNFGAMLTAEDGSSILVPDFGDGSYGVITYKINVSDTNWHLITIPLSSNLFDDTWITDNDIASGTTITTNRAIATYDNTSDADGDWVYHQAGDSNYSDEGIGYSMQKNSSGTLSFFGAFIKNVNKSISISIGNEGTSSENRWNLIGNPIAAYLSIDDFLDYSDNETALTDTHESVYVWNGTDYEALTTGYLHPGQGFFVSAASSSTNVDFTRAMVSHQTTTTLYKGKKSSTYPSIKLALTDGTTTKTTEINYQEGKTKKLDKRYDVGTFTGQDTSFNVYTHLVSNSEGVNFMRQTLPNSDYEDMVVPVGVNATAGKEIIFTADTQNLPTGYKVYLEDKNDGSFTRLDESSGEYKVTLSSDLNGIGRFYLHTRTSVLSTDDDIQLDAVSIYPTSKNTLRITGLKIGANQLSIYNILGKQVFKSNFDSKPVNDINIPNVKTGVYIIQLKTAYGNVNKKVVLK